MRLKIQSCFLVVVLAVYMAATQPAGAQTAAAELDLPAQSLAESLRAVATATNINVLFDTARIERLRARALKGRVTVDEALSHLLNGSGLKYRYLDDNTVVLDAITASPEEANPVSGVSPPSRTQRRADDSASRLTLAQAEPPEDAVRPAAQEESQELIVRGVKITGIVNQGVIPREENQALRYVVFDRSDIERSGATSLQEFFRTVSAVANYGTGVQQVAAFQMALANGVGGFTSPVDLRGFGSTQTLVMVNGRRLYGSESSGPDLSRIPVSAIERIEILPSSGSAIYGANAVGGVVNIVLRRDYRGTELSAYVGAASRGGADETRVSLYRGLSFNGAASRLTLVAEIDRKQSMSLGRLGYYEEALARIGRDSPFYNSQIANFFIGPRATLIQSGGSGLGIPSNPSARVTVVPAGSNGVGLTPASFNSTAGRGAEDTSWLAQAKVIPPLEGYSIFAALDHALRGEALGIYAELSGRYADTSIGEYPGSVPSVALNATNPLNPFRTGVTAGFAGRSVSLFFQPRDLPLDRGTSVQRTYRAVAGLRGKIAAAGERLYSGSFDLSWDRNDIRSRNTSYLRLLRPAVLAGFYNPLRDSTGAAPASQDLLDNLYSRVESFAAPVIGAVNARVNGGWLRLPGGQAQFSVGAEWRNEQQDSGFRYDYGGFSTLPGAVVRQDASTRTSRGAAAGYFEITLPWVGEANRKPWLHALDVNAAARYEKFDDFAGALPVTVAIKLALTADFALRASYSEGFQPPNQVDLHGVETSFGELFDFTDPLRPGLELDAPPPEQVYGGNPRLRAETSETWDAGLILTPRVLPGLTASANYFHYDKRNVVAYLEAQDIIDSVQSRVTRGEPLETDPPGVPGPIVRVDLSPLNLAAQKVDGWDLALDYRHPTDSIGVIAVSADATYTKSNRRQTLPGGAVSDLAGDIGDGEGGPLHWRARGGLRWEREAWAVSWTARYLDSYFSQTNTPTEASPDRLGIDGRNIRHSLEHDVSFSYLTPQLRHAGWLSGIKCTFGALNVFDARPPYRTDRLNLWYSLYNDPRQRFIYLELKKSY